MIQDFAAKTVMQSSESTATADHGHPGFQKFLARQPIFDRHGDALGYEILLRSSLDNYFQAPPGRDTSALIVDNYLLFGLDALTGGRKAFLNFTRDALVQDYAALLPNKHVVVELLENIEPDDEVLAACLRLKKAGFTIALDDFIFTENVASLTRYADIIKVDFLATSPEQQNALARRFAPMGIKMLAEKVETREDVDRGMHLGYVYFQGYFFCKPQMMTKRDIPGIKLNYLRILKAINRPIIDLGEVEAILRQEPSLLYKLLRYMNSANFGLRSRVTSIRHALALLGENSLRKWTSVAAMVDLATDKPAELITTALVRARFCEQLAQPLGLPRRETDLFLLGLMSVMDAVLDRKMNEVLSEIQLPDEVKAALMGETNKLRPALESAVAQELGDWDGIQTCVNQMGFDEAQFPEAYLRAVQWVSKLLEQ
jgi:c-di-GMP-related signal transduction protein